MLEASRLFVVALCFAALGAAAAGSAAARGGKMDTRQRHQCEARKGRIMIAGLSGKEICALPLADAGKSCTSGSQCIGDCLLDDRDTSRRGLTPARPVVGQCQSSDYGFGCRTIVENGRIEHSVCID